MCLFINDGLFFLYKLSSSIGCIIFLCDFLVMEATSYRILLLVKQYDFQDPHFFDDEKLGRLFKVHSLEFSLAFRIVVADVGWWRMLIFFLLKFLLILLLCVWTCSWILL